MKALDFIADSLKSAQTEISFTSEGLEINFIGQDLSLLVSKGYKSFDATAFIGYDYSCNAPQLEIEFSAKSALAMLTKINKLSKDIETI